MDVSAALETDFDDAERDEPTGTTDVEEALSSLPSRNGASGTSSDEKKFQSAIAAWRSTPNEAVIATQANEL